MKPTTPPTPSPTSDHYERPAYGSTEPRVSNVAPAAWSAGDDAITLAESASLFGAPFVLHPWQRWLTKRILGVREDGRWAARDAAYLVSRQNGKGGVLHTLSLAGLFLFDDVREIIHTAHETKTAKKAFRELKGIIESTPHLFAQVERRGKRVVGFRESNENTSITLRDGSVIRYFARATNTARGFSPQWLLIDEAQICSPEARESIFYSTRAQANPLRVWCGTVPQPGSGYDEPFRSLRDRGRRGVDPHLLWAEWSVDPTTPLEDLRTDDDATAQANPALGHMINWDTIESERAAATTPRAWLGLAREILGYWPDGEEDLPWRIWPEDVWLSAARNPDEVSLADPVTFAVEVTPGLETVYISAAGEATDSTAEDPRYMVELVEAFEGVDGAVERLDELVTRHGATGVVVDERSPAAVLIEPLEGAGVPVHRIGTPEAVAASLELSVAISSQSAVWPSGVETAGVLSRAAGVADRRRSRDAWLIDRHDDPDALPLVSVALALYGHRHPSGGSATTSEPAFLVL